MSAAVDERIELTVEGIAAGGAGFGRTASGRIVFVPRTAPGERVTARLTESRRRWARGQVVERHTTGADRVEAPCPYFAVCGGCRMQHLTVEAQSTALRQGVADALQRIGGASVPVGPVEPAGERYRYRNRVSVSLRREGDRVVAGFHAERGDDVVDVEDCLLAEPALAGVWRGLRTAWGAGASRLPAGDRLRLTLRSSVHGEVGLLVEGGDRPPEAGAADALLERVPGLVACWWEPTRGGRRTLAGRETLRDRWEGVELELRPRAFVQTNRRVAARVERYVDEVAGDVGSRRVLDLYAGVGLRAIRWAGSGARVTAVEAEADAVETGRAAAREMGVEVRWRRARVERVLEARAGAAPEVDLVIVNPPRAGLSEDAAAGLRRLGGERLIYVSCDAATLARDVARLAPVWGPERAQPFDAFPNTAHVETVLSFARETESSGPESGA